MKLFLAYFKMQIKFILLFLTFVFIFITVFWLHNLPLNAILYATLLCFSFLFMFSFFNFMSFFNKHKLLSSLNKTLISPTELPIPQNLIEQDYNSLIETLIHDKAQISSYASNEKSDMVDYYTLWAHQIKTPIAAMKLLLQAEDYNNNEFSMELFKIEQYVDMVLQFLRLESISSDFVFKEYKLDSIVRQGIRKYAKLFILKKIELNYRTVNCMVLTDAKWLLFVIEQVLSNALKYTNKGKISIYMDSDTPNILVIEDTGIGIAAEDIPRIFGKSFTGYNGRADKKSTGLGLYLSKQVLSKLSHTIGIESKVGYGTKVKINFNNLTKM